MTKTTYFKYADEKPFDLFVYNDLELQLTSTTSRAVFVDADSDRQVILTGSKLSFAGNDIVGGTATSITLTDSSGTRLLSIKKMNLDASDLWDAYGSGGGNGSIFNVLDNAVLGKDSVTGSSMSDQIYGLGTRNIIHGGGGNDKIEGGDGKDRIFGDAGRDEIMGKDGNDILRGGKGSDEFQYIPHSGHDKILDFDAVGGGNRQDYLSVYENDHFTAKKQGHNVFIEFDSGNTILLVDVRLKDFSADHDVHYISFG